MQHKLPGVGWRKEYRMGEPNIGVDDDTRRGRLEMWLSVVLVVAALDTLYLSLRFTALYGGWVEPGTGLCS
jgi:hypothetical protein